MGRVTTKLLSDLTSSTEYTVAIYAIYDEGQADSLTDSFTTGENDHTCAYYCFKSLSETYCSSSRRSCVVCVFSERAPAPVNVRSSDVSTDNFRVSWQHAASDISLYRLSWTPANGGETREVM